MTINLPKNQINSKANKAMDNLLSRQDYLVVQGNDLAKAFGNLASFQHKVLDYCFSFVTQIVILVMNILPVHLILSTT